MTAKLISLANGLTGFHVESKSNRLAILLHPYGPLGGNCENHLVKAICKLFSKNAYSCLRFDMKGSGSSPGRTSWNGQPECNDLIEICKDDRFIDKEIVLVGYSYGSVIACFSALAIPNVVGLVSISYPSSFLWALTAFNQKIYLDGLRNLSPDLEMLFVIGKNDNFSSLRQWESMLDGANVKMENRVVIDSDHFFNTCQELRTLVDAVCKKFRFID
jgi:uncharacterized protein